MIKKTLFFWSWTVFINGIVWKLGLTNSKLWKVLQLDPILGQIVNPLPVMVANRGRNSKNMLVNFKLQVQLWNILQLDSILGQIVDPLPLMVANRGRKLKNMLVNFKL